MDKMYRLIKKISKNYDLIEHYEFIFEYEDYDVHVQHEYSILLEKRKKLIAKLKKQCKKFIDNN